MDDPSDSTGASYADGDTTDYKRVFVEISSTTGPAFTYRAQTSIHDTTKDPAVKVQGVNVEILDDATGAVINDDAFEWRITITGAGVTDEDVHEGTTTTTTCPPVPSPARSPTTRAPVSGTPWARPPPTRRPSGAA